ncbi:hypothetical protein [Streptomyces cavernae]|uniref:hypothetical protein n=1 Tax=Streptomyces cavernae TaxID=2259034 RepID=UPI00192E4419|nr:hypothetical protein [Streptomyces cavernae]
MTPWLRAPRTACLLLVLAAASVHPAHAADTDPGQGASRAGSRYGEGRERPGRNEPPPPEAVPTYTAEAPPAVAPSRDAALPTGRGLPPASTEPVLRVLPLGSGLILIGAGLGLAFVGLRVRRG